MGWFFEQQGKTKAKVGNIRSKRQGSVATMGCDNMIHGPWPIGFLAAIGNGIAACFLLVPWV